MQVAPYTVRIRDVRPVYYVRVYYPRELACNTIYNGVGRRRTPRAGSGATGFSFP